MRAEERVERDGVGGRDVGERGVCGGEIVALGVEINERVGDGEAAGEEREAEGERVQGGAEREQPERRGGVEREGEGEVVGGDGEARHEEEQAERGARVRLGEAANGAVEEGPDDGGGVPACARTRCAWTAAAAGGGWSEARARERRSRRGSPPCWDAMGGGPAVVGGGD